MRCLPNTNATYLTMLLAHLLEHLALVAELVRTVVWVDPNDSGVDEGRQYIANVQDQQRCQLYYVVCTIAVPFPC